MKRFFVLLIIAVLFLPASLRAKTIKQYTKEIQSKTQDLQQLQQAIKEKRIEKEHRLLEEKTIQRELRRIERALDLLQAKKQKIRRETKKAEKNMALAEKSLRLADWEKTQWSEALQRELDLLFRAHHSHSRLFSDPLGERLRLQALRQKKTYLTNAQIKELNSKKAREKWKNARERLISLKKQQEENIAQQKEIRIEKKEILKTTIGKRIASEEEITSLVDSARELQKLITQLGKEKKRSEEEFLQHKRFAGMKKQLVWPVQGEIQAKFGKIKHPDLDTYLISNGIKINAQPGAAVRAVESGEVIYSGQFRSYGEMVIVDHGGGFYTLYGSLGEIAVEEDQAVKRGDVIGTLSTPGPAILYFEVRSDGKAQDPLLWLRSD